MNSKYHKSLTKSTKDLTEKNSQQDKSKIKAQSQKKITKTLQSLPLLSIKAHHKTQPSQLQSQMQLPSNNNRQLMKSEILMLNSLKISPSKQYQTRLKISADRWLVYDYRINNYKRGWKPAESADFSGMVRLLCLRFNPDLKNVNFRVNIAYLKEQIQLAHEKKLSPSKRQGLIIKQAISRVFQNNMVINVIDMLYGLLMSSFDDIIQYSVVFLGYICYCHIKQKNLPQCVFIQKVSQALDYAKYFGKFTHQHLFPSLQMQDSRFKSQVYRFQSSSNDICRMYLSLESFQLFQEIIKCNQIECKIKYQMGYNFWENRILLFKNKRAYLGPQYDFVGSWRSKHHFSVLAKNNQLKTLTVLQDSRFGMLELDIRCIQKWVIDIRKPIGGAKNNSTLLPLIKLTDGNNINIKRQIERSVTQS